MGWVLISDTTGREDGGEWLGDKEGVEVEDVSWDKKTTVKGEEKIKVVSVLIRKGLCGIEKGKLYSLKITWWEIILYQKELNKHNFCVDHHSQETKIRMNENQTFVDYKDVIKDNKHNQKPL